MIAEYEALREARTTTYTGSTNSSNLFLAAVSGGTIALALISQVLKGDTCVLASLVILVGLLLLGVCTFVRTLEGQIVCRVYVRGMNRIRHYFVELTPNVADYIILPVNDDVPKFYTAGLNPSKWAVLINLPGMIAIINSIIGSVLIVGTLMVLFALPTLQTILWGGVIFTVMFIAHFGYQMMRFKKAERETKIRFPSTQTHK